MLPDKIQKIAETINKFYLPATIKDYDSLIVFNDFKNLFPAISMPLDDELKKALEFNGFYKENLIDEKYFIKLID